MNEPFAHNISVKSQNVPDNLKMSSKKFEQSLLRHLNSVDFKLPIGIKRVSFPLSVLSLEDPFNFKVLFLKPI